MEQRTGFRRYLMPLFVSGMYLFLYIPIIVLIIFSFNDSVFPYVWKGFTFKWYLRLWESTEVWNALTNSLIVASSTVVLSLVMGLLLVFFGSRTWMGRLLIMFYGSLSTPEVVLAVGLVSLFSLCNVPLGYTTLIAGHTLMGLGYVVPLLHDRYRELDYSITEASYDLGATRWQTFWRIILPLLSPAIFAATLLVFVISLDDFIISFFCSGASTQTLPMYIFSMIRSGTTPVVNALSTMLMLISSFLVILFSSLKVKNTDMLP